MSQSREKKRRYNQKLQHIEEYNRWLMEEPPRMFFISWHLWKKRKPTWGKQI